MSISTGKKMLLLGNGRVAWFGTWIMFKSLFELYMRLTGYNIQLAAKYLKQIQQFDPEQFQAWQDKQKWKIARYHYDHNPMYRQKVGSHFPDEWEALPIMKKSDYQLDLEQMLSEGFQRKNLYTANTSGSSGHPFFFAKNKAAHAMDWALIKDRYQWHGLSLSSKQARFYGIPLGKWSYGKEILKDRLMNRVRFPVFDLSDEMLTQYASIFQTKKFEYVYGYANSLLLFAQYLLKEHSVLKNICPSLKLCISTSEVLWPEDRETLSHAFGVKVINEYGASEVGLLAFEDQNADWLLCEETLFMETIGEAEQQEQGLGSIVVTDLDNLAMPFIRYDIGDVGAFGEADKATPNYRKLGSLFGRENDTIRLPSGKISPGLTFYYVSRSILESSNAFKEFIIRQTALDSFVFDIVSDRELSPDEVREIKNKMETYLEPGLKLEIRRVSKIERPASGKRKHFYSELN